MKLPAQVLIVKYGCRTRITWPKAKSPHLISIHFLRRRLAFCLTPPHYAVFIIIIFKCNDNKRSLITIFNSSNAAAAAEKSGAEKRSGSEGHRGTSKENGANGAHISHSQPAFPTWETRTAWLFLNPISHHNFITRPENSLLCLGSLSCPQRSPPLQIRSLSSLAIADLIALLTFSTQNWEPTKRTSWWKSTSHKWEKSQEEQMQSGFFDRNSVFEPYLHVRLLIEVEQSHQLCLVDLPLCYLCKKLTSCPIK